MEWGKLVYLSKLAQVLKVGYAWRRLVTRQHARPWLVEVPDAGWEGDIVTGGGSSKGASSSVGSASRPPPTTVIYQVRPWRHFHGRRLDLGGLRRVLERVLSDVMARPGQRVAALCDQLNPHILPVVTLDALEILEEIGCIRFVSLQARPKLDMFSNRSRKMSLCSQSDTSPVDMAVDVPVATPLRFASFIQAVRKHYTSPVDMAVDVPVATPLRFASFIQAVRKHCEPQHSPLAD
ncbi:general transcription factor 3c polypeptide [Plakobranchus ocellatus]|uniref:General transcription factor 3c polypeptide n=1 Tax=Plakobranchus ocellatus TaxID=259542 RepID=A0AAV3Y5I0_9GAST|nr:general transcription factor 3c polypeptide [Plakobranchus ocellatus]